MYSGLVRTRPRLHVRRARDLTAAVAACVLGLAAAAVGTGHAQASGAGPALLEADAQDAGHVELAWTVVPGASQYTVYRDGSVLSVANTLHTTDTTVAPNSAHSYTVTATVSGTETGPSPTGSVNVPAPGDTTAPTAPTSLVASSVTSTTAKLTWVKSTDNVAVIGYFVKIGSVLYTYTEGSTSANVPYLKASTPYTFTVTALDAAGNQSTSAPVSFTTAALGTTDTTPPGTPSLTATPYSSSEVDLSWSKPGDSDLTGFLVYQGAVLLEDVPPNSSALTRVLPVTGLSAQTAYTFSVKSYDAAGNQSAASIKTATTLAPTTVNVTRGPYVQRVDATSARVIWRTNIATSSNLTYTYGTTSTTVVDAALRTDHSVLIGPLPSLSKIDYTLNYPSAKTGSFNTCSASPATLNLDAVGDMGGGATAEKDIANLVAADKPDLIAAMGDNVYPTGLDQDYPARLFTPYAGAMKVAPFVTTFGNHEYYSPGAADARRAYSQPGNEGYFSFDCSGVHFVVLDAYQPYTSGSTQYQWLANDLATTTQPWKVVIVHIPPYSSSAGSGKSSTGVVLNSLFEQNHVQLVIGGHSHNYERTNAINGVTYFVDGGGGNGLNAFSGSPPSWSAYRAAEYSYIRFTITPSLLSGAEIRENGSTGDTFSIAGSGSTPPDTVIDSQPSPLTKATTASFAFHSTQTPATFQCTLDGGAASSCVSPATYSGLAEGSHSFSVTATSSSGPDPSPATFSWTVDTTAPSIPAGLSATAPTSTKVNLSWSASTDLTGVTGYDVIRDGSTLATVSGATTSYVDTTVSPGTSYTYTVDALDGAGNVSSPSAPASVTTPTGTAAPALVQAAGSITSTVTLPVASTQGDLLVMSVGVYTGATNHITSVTDTAGNTWIRVGAYSVSSHNSDGEMWYAANANPATAITVHQTTVTNTALEVQEFSGVATSNALDLSGGSSNTSTAASSGSITPNAGNELLVGFVAGHGSAQVMTPGAGFTNQPQKTTGASVASVVAGYEVLASPSAQAYSATFATAMYWASGIAAFKAAS